MNKLDQGYCKGEICNRGGCVGVIAEHDLDGGCSCHINPPCSYCETAKEYCPECNWDAYDEQTEDYRESLKNSYKGFGSKKMHDDYYEAKAKQDAFDTLFNAMFRGQVEAEKLTIVRLSHSNASMKIKGVFPKGTETRETIQNHNHVRGTFGGRFESFTDHSFVFIAYTD